MGDYIELIPTNECLYCISGEKIPFSLSMKCNDPDKSLKIVGYPNKYDIEYKIVKCNHFTPDPDKI